MEVVSGAVLSEVVVAWDVDEVKGLYIHPPSWELWTRSWPDWDCELPEYPESCVVLLDNVDMGEVMDKLDVGKAEALETAGTAERDED